MKRFAIPIDKNKRTRMETATRYNGVPAMTEEMKVGIYSPSVMVKDKPSPRIGAISAIYRITRIPLPFAKQLMDNLLSDIKEQGMVGVHLITAREGSLPAFYEKFGFSKEKRVMLMGREL